MALTGISPSDPIPATRRELIFAAGPSSGNAGDRPVVLWGNITGTGMTSMELADYLLQEAGVAALSGTSFGQYGEGYLRISFANSKENLEKALERIEAALNKKTLDKDRQ